MEGANESTELRRHPQTYLGFVREHSHVTVGKDHCIACLQFNKTGFDQKYVCYLYEVKQLNPNL